MGHLTRRALLGLLAVSAASPLAAPGHAADKTPIKVWKSPTCGCCRGWIAHLEANGFKAEVVETNNVAEVKRQLHVPSALSSCHTAVVAGYVIEGHVPAAAIAQLLQARPTAIGLAVPGMPIGSPGMEGGRPETYDVLLFGPGEPPSRFAKFMGSRQL